jgi:hypothetical protein
MRTSKPVSYAIATSILTAITLTVPTKANAQPLTGTTWGKLVGFGDRCLDIQGASTADRTPVQLWDCTGVNEQKWVINPQGGPIWSRLGTVLDSPFPSDDFSTTWSFDYWNGPNQQWAMTDMEILGIGGNCLDVPYTASGSIVWMFQCWGGTNQKWSFNPITEEITTSDGRCLQWARLGDGSPVVAVTCNQTATNQIWGTGPNGTLTAGFNSGYCLDVDNGGTADRTMVQLWSCSGSVDQTFSFMGEIESTESGKCLQVPGAGGAFDTGDGAQPDIFECNGAENQLWNFRW